MPNWIEKNIFVLDGEANCVCVCVCVCVGAWSSYQVYVKSKSCCGKSYYSDRKFEKTVVFFKHFRVDTPNDGINFKMSIIENL